MAQTGYTPIILYHSTTASEVPLSANLVSGEFAVNINDMKLYCENSAGTVTLLASADAAVGKFASLTSGRLPLVSTGGQLIDSADITWTDTAASLQIKLEGSASTSALFSVINTHASGDAVHSLRANGTGDSYVSFDVTGGTTIWTAGPDNSDGDAFIIGPNGTHGANNALRIATSLAATFSDDLTVAGELFVADGSDAAPSISNTGDTNTGIYFPAANQLAVATNGVERVRVSDTGIGIGTLGSAATMLELESANNAGTALNILRFSDSSASSAVGDPFGKIEFYSNTGLGGGVGVKAYVRADLRSGVNGGGDIIFGVSPATAGVDATDGFEMGSTYFRPVDDGLRNLGGASNKWDTVYAAVGAINTSDARLKTAVQDFTKKELDAAKQLSKEIGTFKYLKAVQEKGGGARMHIGMTVQRAIEIMEQNGLDPFAYGFICHDSWEDEFVDRPEIPGQDAVADEKGNIIKERKDPIPAVHIKKKSAGDVYGFRHDQLLLFISRGFEERLAALENSQ